MKNSPQHTFWKTHKKNNIQTATVCMCIFFSFALIVFFFLLHHRFFSSHWIKTALYHRHSLIRRLTRVLVDRWLLDYVAYAHTHTQIKWVWTFSLPLALFLFGGERKERLVTRNHLEFMRERKFSIHQSIDQCRHGFNVCFSSSAVSRWQVNHGRRLMTKHAMTVLHHGWQQNEKPNWYRTSLSKDNWWKQTPVAFVLMISD